MKAAFTTPLSIFTLQAFAQQNFQPGSIVKISGETVKGYIDYRGWERNPKSIRFREGENGAVATFTVEDLASFKIDDKDSYRRAEVEKDMRPIAIDRVTTFTKDSVAKDTVFLRLVTNGPKLSLFELYDEKPHFYISDSTGAYQELIYKVYAHPIGLKNHIVMTFRDQLRLYGNNDTRLTKKLRDAKYDETDLATIVNLINGNEAAPLAKSGGSRAEFFVSGGISYSFIKFEGLSKLDGMRSYSSFAPTLGVGVDVISKRNLGAIALRFEVLYTSSEFKGKGRRTNQANEEYESEYDFKIHNFAPSLSFLVSPIRKPSYRMYAGLGIGLNIASYKGNVLREVNLEFNQPYVWDGFLDLESSWLSIPLQVGAIAGNFEFIVSTKLIGNFERIPALNSKFSFTSLRAAYRF